MKLAVITLTLCLAVTAGHATNAISGGTSAEDALRRFDQHLFDAWAAKLPPGGRPRQPVDGYVAELRVPVAMLSYYRGQSTVAGRELSCASRSSLILWYGSDAVLVWQDGLWFPDRPAVHRRYAETGHLR